MLTEQQSDEKRSEFLRKKLFDTVIHATKQNDLEPLEGVLKLFNKAKMSVNCQNPEDGLTVLHWAVVAKNMILVQCLLAVGANPNTPNHSGLTPLHIAVEKNCFKLVKYLVQEGADPNQTDHFGQNALHWAAIVGSVEILRYFLDLVDAQGNQKTDPNQLDIYQRTLLHIAASYGYVGVVQCLIDLKDEGGNQKINLHQMEKDGLTALGLAVMRDHKNLIGPLLKAGSDPTKVSPQGFTVWHVLIMKDKEMLNCFVQAGVDLKQVVCWATMKGYLEIVEHLVQSLPKKNLLASTDNRGRTPLSIAVEYEQIAVVKWLVAQKGKGVDLAKTDYAGWIPLHIASEKGHRDIIQCLVEAGSDPNQPNDHGVTALHRAAFMGHLPVLEYLFSLKNKKGQKRVDLNQFDQDGQTAFHKAVLRGHVEVITWLVREGKVDPNQPDNAGQTALAIAMAMSDSKMVECLRDLGADAQKPDKSGWTPGFWALQNGYEVLLKLGELEKAEEVATTMRERRLE